jgi:hypothetical protein
LCPSPLLLEISLQNSPTSYTDFGNLVRNKLVQAKQHNPTNNQQNYVPAAPAFKSFRVWGFTRVLGQLPADESAAGWTSKLEFPNKKSANGGGGTKNSIWVDVGCCSRLLDLRGSRAIGKGREGFYVLFFSAGIAIAV